jgi:succinoglycan biosynthesis protein ExoM
MTRPRLTVVIVARRRPAGLITAARSAFHQGGLEPGVTEIVIVGADEAGWSAAVAAGLAEETALPVAHIQAPRRSAAFARNAGLAAARGAFVAFLDDDQEASPAWLTHLVEAQARYDADVVFGPVTARLPRGLGAHRPYLDRFFSRRGPGVDGLTVQHYGAGGALIRRAALPDPDAAFPTTRGQAADDVLFTKMRAAGARFAWAPRGWIWAAPDYGSLNLRYAIGRAFAHGQAPSNARAIACPPDRLGVAETMAAGAAQAVVFGLIAVAKWFVGAKGWVDSLDLAARGLGMTFWWGPFRPRPEGGGP